MRLLKFILPVILVMSFLGKTYAMSYPVSENPFPDVILTSTYANEIQYIKENKFADGFSDGTFRPHNKITRAELIKIITNAEYGNDIVNSPMIKNMPIMDYCLNLHNSMYNSDINKDPIGIFPDVMPDDQFAKFVCIAKNNNIVSGYNDGNFKLNNEVTFGEAAKMIIRTLDNTHGINADAKLEDYLNKLYEKNAYPQTIKVGDKDHVISRGEASFLIQIVDSSYVKLPPENYDNWDIQPSIEISSDKDYIATIVTNYGNIKLDLFETTTPITVNNFIFLAKKDFYDGTIFHRVIKDFIIQGGDPSGSGLVGPGYTFEDEFHSSLSNEKWTISMANSGPNTNGSQFFFNLQDNIFLDGTNGTYSTVFGKVIEGTEVLDKISDISINFENKPIFDVTIIDVVIEIR